MDTTYSISADANQAINVDLSIECIICEEPVLLTDMERSRLNYGLDIHSKICDKCKKAILYYRRKFEGGEE